MNVTLVTSARGMTKGGLCGAPSVAVSDIVSFA